MANDIFLGYCPSTITGTNQQPTIIFSDQLNLLDQFVDPVEHQDWVDISLDVTFVIDLEEDVGIVAI